MHYMHYMQDMQVEGYALYAGAENGEWVSATVR